MFRRNWWFVLAASLAAALWAPAHPADSARLQAERLVSECPGLDLEFARHIVTDDPSAWAAYCRSIGVRGVLDAWNSTASSLRAAPYPEFCRRRRLLEGMCLRMALTLNEVFDYPAPLEGLRFASGLPNERSFEVYRLVRLQTETVADAAMPASDKLRKLEEIRTRLMALGGDWSALRTDLDATRLELELGRPDRHRARLTASLAEARRLREHFLVCQVLGELGATHRNAGEMDSMRICFDEALRLARQHGFVEQAARLLRFDASYYVSRGRLALAADRLAEAQELCASPGAGTARLRMQIEHAAFLARLECWDLAARSLRRLPPLFRQFPQSASPPEAQKLALDAGCLEARLAFAEHDARRGDSLMRVFQRAMPPGYRRMGFAELYDAWSAGLVADGRWPEALEACERGLSHCDTAHVPEKTFPLLARRAKVLDQMGRQDDAARTLDAVEQHLRAHPSRDENLMRGTEILRARLLWSRGQTGRARALLADCLRQFLGRLRDRENGMQNYLELEDAVALRDAVHEIGGLGPEAGYRFECEWRSLSERSGRARPEEDLWTFSAIAAAGSQAPAACAHLVFRFDREVLLRWTASSSGVALDTLRLSPAQCLAQVREALALLQQDQPPPGSVMSAATRLQLKALSRILLPASLEEIAGRPAVVLVSPDGPLSALPFEALPAPGPRGEEPLAAWADVAYAHGSRRASRRTADRAVIVSDPALSPELRRRYAAAVDLPGSGGEVVAALARWPDAAHLHGERATKSAVLASWRHASHIYLAAHHVRDPDAPFLGFVPLAAPSGAPPDAALLEIADLRGLDLSTCRLVVLAACATGAPYRLAQRPGPSLGQAFLDSGAESVVQSFWDVGDRDASAFMQRFLAAYAEHPDAAVALGRARRAAMAAPAGAPPRVWAVWSAHVSLSRAPRSPEPAAPSIAPGGPGRGVTRGASARPHAARGPRPPV